MRRRCRGGRVAGRRGRQRRRHRRGQCHAQQPPVLERLDQPDRGLADRLIFWQQPERPGVALDARRESQRLRENAALGREATEGETPIIQRSRSSNPLTRLLESIF